MYSFIFNCSAQMGRQLYSWHSRSSPITGIHGLSLHISLSLSHTHQIISPFQVPSHPRFNPDLFRNPRSPLAHSRPATRIHSIHLNNGLSCSTQPTPKRGLGISPRTPEWHRLARYSRASVWGRQFGHHPRARFTRGVCGFEKVVVELC